MVHNLLKFSSDSSASAGLAAPDFSLAKNIPRQSKLLLTDFAMESQHSPRSPTFTPKFTRKIHDRVFVNRNLNLEKIHWFGFDMDYTLAVYKDEFEVLQYNLVISKLIQKGYPESLKDLKYDPTFGVRGIYIDKHLGNFIKIDQFGYILSASHGRRKIVDSNKVYPEQFIYPEEIGKRYYCIDTLFGFPEICLYSDIITCLEELGEITGKVGISYQSVFEDIRTTMDNSHRDGSLKNAVIEDISKYIRKDDRLALMFHRFRASGRKVFLLTNSEYYYTNKVMAYMLSGVREDYPSWKDYFDAIVVNACKPLFFGEGTTLREVDEKTGLLKFTEVGETFEKGKVYNGGNLKMFRKLTGTVGSEILYIGDNIAHDIIRSKDSRVFWRTCLIVKELDREIDVWKGAKKEYENMVEQEWLRANTFQGMDSTRVKKPDGLGTLKSEMKKATAELDAKFNPYFGSLFRSGTSESKFSTEVTKYADLYAADHLHFLNYPLFYYFAPTQKSYPHEVIEEM
jgi:5'-nucleotidase